MAVKLVEHTNGSHIFMRMKLDNGRIEEIDVYLQKDGSEKYVTSADPGGHEEVREQIIAAFNDLY